ncbi:hypothetical protein [Demequina pelophila]|uniref:hypothetical protein n=1 Tax=Demequina pelophila TaxID=1638984 RepID=UPI000785A283|nr:hypothetical protein [Demequina pelophila]
MEVDQLIAAAEREISDALAVLASAARVDYRGPAADGYRRSLEDRARAAAMLRERVRDLAGWGASGG